MPGGTAHAVKKTKPDTDTDAEIEPGGSPVESLASIAPIEATPSSVQAIIADHLPNTDLLNVIQSSLALGDPKHSGFAETLIKRKVDLEKTLQRILVGHGCDKFDALLEHMAATSADYRLHIPTSMASAQPTHALWSAYPLDERGGSETPMDIPNVLRTAIYSKINSKQPRWSSADAVSGFSLIKEICSDGGFLSVHSVKNTYHAADELPKWRITFNITLLTNAFYRHNAQVPNNYLYSPPLYLVVSRFGDWDPGYGPINNGESLGDSVKVLITDNPKFDLETNRSRKTVRIVRHGGDGTEVIEHDAFGTALKQFDKDMSRCSDQDDVAGAGEALLNLIKTSHAEIIPRLGDETMNGFVDSIVWAMCQSGRPFRTEMTADEKEAVSLHRQILTLTEKEQTVTENFQRKLDEATQQRDNERQTLQSQILPLTEQEQTIAHHIIEQDQDRSGERPKRKVVFASSFTDCTFK